MITFFLIFALVFFILFSGFLSGSETSLFSLSTFTLKSYKKNPDSRKRLIARLLSNPRELLVTIMMLNVLSNLLVQNVVSSLFGGVASWLMKVGVPLVLTLFFGEIIPKSLALPNNVAISYRAAPFIAKIARILGPIRVKITRLTGYISRVIFFFLKKDKDLAVDELLHILQTSKEKGILDSSETDLSRGYLELQGTSVKEQMRPREEILFYDTKKPIAELLHLFVDLQCSRVPVCEGGLENILGMISTREYFFHKDKIKAPQDLIAFLKKPFFIPESTKAWMLLRQLREKGESIAMVVDEYGSICGLITQEDLIESVIGEISDRRDEKSPYTFSGDQVIIASGKMEITELEDLFHVQFPPHPNVVTLGGWLTEKLGYIPQAGTKHMSEHFLFYVLAADPNRVRRIYVRCIKKKKRL